MASLKGIGTEDKKKVAVAAALGLVVLVLAIHTLFGGPEPSPAPPSVPVRTAATAVAPPAPAAAGRPKPTQGSAVAETGSTSLDPQLHPELMAENENYLYRGIGRNIFSQTSGTPPPDTPIPRVTAPVRPSVQTASLPAGPPPPPTIDLRFFGYSSREDGVKRAFLLHGDDVFVAAEGDVVSHRYKVVRIGPFSIQVEDLPYNDTQTLPLVQN